MRAQYRPSDAWPEDVSCNDDKIICQDDEVICMDDESAIPIFERWFGPSIRQILDVAKPLIAILRR